MAPDKEKLREDQIFNIITGYYPEIAATVKYMAGMKGKGQVGVKFRRKRGFSKQTIERDNTKGLPSPEWNDKESNTNVKMSVSTEGASWKTKATALGEEGGTLAGENLYKKRVGVKGDKKKIWYKFTGGGDMYKIYGDMSWYMHGTRVENTLTDYVNSVAPESQNSPAFGQIYSKMEGKLAQEALQMARDIFDTTVEKIKEDLEKADYTGQMSAEEMGYKADSFEYLSKGELLSKINDNIIPDPTGELKAQLTSVEGSMANPRDLYKISKDGDKHVIDLMQDVSERDIQDLGQHGITEIPEDLKLAIEEVKKGDKGQNMSKLKTAVALMYTNAITKEYNPMIRAAKVTGKYVKGADNLGYQNKKWKKVLEDIGGTDASTGKSVGVSQIGKVLGISTESVHFMDKSSKDRKQTALELISHVLGTMNEKTTAEFRTSHRVHTYPSGESVYATVNITPDPDTLLFKETLKAGDVGIVEGYNVTLAQEQLSQNGIANNGKAVMIGQKHNYSASKVTGVTAAGTSVSSCTATLGVAKGLRNTTAVHIPAKGDLEDKLVELVVNGIPDLSSKLGQDSSGTSSSTLQERMYGLDKNRKLRKAKWRLDQPNFWALPYIGVSQSEYIEK